MPIPKPRADEEQGEYIGRCNEAMASEFPDAEQRNAVCFDAWRKRKKRKGEASHACSGEQAQRAEQGGRMALASMVKHALETDIQVNDEDATVSDIPDNDEDPAQTELEPVDADHTESDVWDNDEDPRETDIPLVEEDAPFRPCPENHVWSRMQQRCVPPEEG